MLVSRAIKVGEKRRGRRRTVVGLRALPARLLQPLQRGQLVAAIAAVIAIGLVALHNLLLRQGDELGAVSVAGEVRKKC